MLGEPLSSVAISFTKIILLRSTRVLVNHMQIWFLLIGTTAKPSFERSLPAGFVFPNLFSQL